MKKKFSTIKNFFWLIYLFFITSIIIYIFSFYSMQKGRVYNLFWIKSIQENLYWHGFIKPFPFECQKHDKRLLYVPREGDCKFSNIEFDTKLSFTKYYRKNDNKITFEKPEKTPIAVLGDSVSMGWGVNNKETYASVIERNLKRKVYNFGVGGYGTHREVLRFIKSPYYKEIDKVIIQYHFNDHEENLFFDEKKIYSADEFEVLTKKEGFTGTEKAFFALRRFKSIFRLLYREIKGAFVQKGTPDFNVHYDGILKVLKKYNYLDGKKIILFNVSSHNMQFKNYKIGKFKNIDFVNVNLEDERHFFILDDHLNPNGHLEVGKQLTQIINDKGW